MTTNDRPAKQTALNLLYTEGVDQLVLAAADYMVRDGKGHWTYSRTIGAMPDNGERAVEFADGESTITIRESQARA